ncbi:MAG: ceramidase domain-containing protein [Elusimicrobia bacterium]|nr:ceramidase domain-containing protein [Elusimicrobiota bacterium]
MDPRAIPPLPSQSPWSAWARPDIHHCEANLAGWIAAPADTWSNLAYLAVGWWLWRRSPRGPYRALSAISIVVGLCSFAFHASFTYEGQVLDFAAMFLLTGWLLARGAVRARWISEDRLNAAWAAVVGFSLSLFAAFHARGIPVQTIMIAHVAAVALFELRLRLSGPRAPSYGPFAAALGLIAAAYACWQLDHAERFCAPDNHLFQWHAVWHVLTAAAFVPLARFQSRATAAPDAG